MSAGQKVGRTPTSNSNSPSSGPAVQCVHERRLQDAHIVQSRRAHMAVRGIALHTMMKMSEPTPVIAPSVCKKSESNEGKPAGAGAQRSMTTHATTILPLTANGFSRTRYDSHSSGERSKSPASSCRAAVRLASCRCTSGANRCARPSGPCLTRSRARGARVRASQRNSRPRRCPSSPLSDSCFGASAAPRGRHGTPHSRPDCHGPCVAPGGGRLATRDGVLQGT